MLLTQTSKQSKENKQRERKKTYVCCSDYLCQSVLVLYGMCLLSCCNFLNIFISCFLLPRTHWHSGDNKMMDVTFSLGRWEGWTEVGRMENSYLCVSIRWRNLGFSIVLCLLFFLYTSTSCYLSSLWISLLVGRYTEIIHYKHHICLNISLGATSRINSWRSLHTNTCSSIYTELNANMVYL